MNTFPPSPQTQKIIINSCYGGWGISHDGMMEYFKRAKIEVFPEELEWGGWLYWADEKHTKDTLDHREDLRTDPILVQMVEESPGRWDGTYADLKVVEVPAGVSWDIDEYDGIETIHESHRSWS